MRLVRCRSARVGAETSTRSPIWWSSGWIRRMGRTMAKRLLPQARAAGYQGSAPNFRRLVAQAKVEWRQGHHRGRRPGVWAPAETLIIDWGVQAGVHVFCAVSAWSRFRFVRFADNEKAAMTFGLLAECFEVLVALCDPARYGPVTDAEIFGSERDGRSRHGGVGVGLLSMVNLPQVVPVVPADHR